ncbi:hypothetical protein [Micromonospora sp. NPDC005161]
MTRAMRVAVAGYAEIEPVPEVPLALDEMIYRVTSEALAHAGMTINDIAGACMAASDLNDGRAISTMTLTGSTGSFGKTELRACNDSLSALMLGAAEVASGAADAIMVCSWSKFSDADPDVIRPLALEPVMHRGLGFHPDVMLGLARSRSASTVTTTAQSRATPVDVASAVVLTQESWRSPHAWVRGVGGSMGAYLGASGDYLGPLREAADRACTHARIGIEDVDHVVVGGFLSEADDALASVLGVPGDKLRRQKNPTADLGYATGLTVLVEELGASPGATVLVASSGGLVFENTYATVVEMS